MPGTALTWKERISQFVSNTLTTNTPGEMIGQVTNIVKRYKPWRSAACLVAVSAGGGGGVPAFLFIPQVYNYFAPAVEQLLPDFLGTVGVDITIGVIGFWVGGAVVFNLAKSGYQEYSLRVNGHTNTELEVSDEKVGAIVDANPHLYEYKDGQGDPLPPEQAQVKKAFDINQLKTVLLGLRDMIDKYKGDGTTRHDDLKHIVTSAIRSKDLSPLLEKNATDQTKRDLRINLAALLAGHISEAQPENFKAVHIQNANEIQIQIDEPDANPVLPAQIPLLGVAGANNLRQEAQVFSNSKKRTLELTQSNVIHSKRHRVDTTHARSDASKANLVQGLGTVIRREAIKKNQDAQLGVGDPEVRQRLGLRAN